MKLPRTEGDHRVTTLGSTPIDTTPGEPLNSPGFLFWRDGCRNRWREAVKESGTDTSAVEQLRWEGHSWRRTVCPSAFLKASGRICLTTKLTVSQITVSPRLATL